MRKSRIDKRLLNKLVREGRSQKEIAQRLGVSPSAVCRVRQQLGLALAKVTLLEEASRVFGENIDILAQLRKINGYAHELLDLLMRWNRGDEEALQVLESQVHTIRIRGIEEEVKQYRFKDPRELALKAMSTIQSQLEFQMGILEKLFDVEQVQKFQSEIIELLGEVSPKMRDEFLRRLYEKSALRRAVRFD